MFCRLIEIGRCCGMEINAANAKVVGVSGQPDEDRSKTA
jgi:hypothetical protein